jgi:chemotaxis protein MotA
MFLLDQIARYVDPFAMMIVFGGTLMISFARSTRADLARGWGALGAMYRADPEADSTAAWVAISRIREIVELKNVMCADRVETAQRFLKRAVHQLSNARSSTDFARWASDEVERRRERHQAAAGVWRGIAETAPAMGMIGTIIGLVQMFASMDDPSKIGPGMAVAMLTTLYGIILSAAIAAPIAGRLERLSEAELAWQGAACKQLELLLRDEVDGLPAKARTRHRMAS